MRVHYLQHVPFEGLGTIENWLNEKEYVITVTSFYESNYKLPSINDIDALIIMGGPMGAYDEDKYPWLKHEKEFIKASISANKKVLGICLGSQLIAACLGADVHVAAYKEIGWFTLEPTAACEEHPWFYNLFKHNPKVFHWHGDQFDIPTGSTNLLNSAANSNHAFIYNNNVLALQFHLEVEQANILKMIESCPEDLDKGKYVQSIEQILKQAKNTATTGTLLNKLLDHFIGT